MPKRNYISVATSTTSTQILVSNTILQKQEIGLFGKWLTPGLGQKINIQDELVISESKEVLKN